MLYFRICKNDYNLLQIDDGCVFNKICGSWKITKLVEQNWDHDILFFFVVACVDLDEMIEGFESCCFHYVFKFRINEGLFVC